MAEGERRRRWFGGPPVSWRVLCTTAAFMAVVTAAMVQQFAARFPAGEQWGPLASWFAAGIVIGATLQRRAPALTVAIVTTVIAGVASAVINYIAPTQYPAGPSRTMFLTLTCTLSCVLGAAAVVELWRQLDARRRRRR